MPHFPGVDIKLQMPHCFVSLQKRNFKLSFSASFYLQHEPSLYNKYTVMKHQNISLLNFVTTKFLLVVISKCTNLTYLCSNSLEEQPQQLYFLSIGQQETLQTEF